MVLGIGGYHWRPVETPTATTESERDYWRLETTEDWYRDQQRLLDTGKSPLESGRDWWRPVETSQDWRVVDKETTGHEFEVVEANRDHHTWRLIETTACPPELVEPPETMETGKDCWRLVESNGDQLSLVKTNRTTGRAWWRLLETGRIPWRPLETGREHWKC